MQVRSIVIANIIEFNRRAMTGGFTPGEYVSWDTASTDLTDMALFWYGDSKLVILPRPPDEEFVSDIKIALRYNNVRVISPARTSSSICKDILEDTDLFGFLVDSLRTSESSQIITWGVTDQFYVLLDELQRAGVSVCCQTPEAPPKDKYWTALYLESKAGFREFAARLQEEIPGLHLPEGFTCGSKELAVEAIGHFWSKQRGFVFKANYGTGGFSTLCYPANLLARGLKSLRRDALHRMSFDHFWDNPPVILEEHIPGPNGSRAIVPTIDFIIDSDGMVRMMGAGTMLMRRDWLYSGIQCGLGSLDPAIEATMIRIGRQVGYAMADMGYRGWFDIDFVIGAEGEIFLTEINARKASPAHVFDIASHILGESWMCRCSIYANDHLRLQGSCCPSYSTIRKVFAAFNSDHNEISVRAIPTIASSSLSRRTPYLGYAVLAEDTPDASYYAAQLEGQIRDAIGMNLDSQ